MKFTLALSIANSLWCFAHFQFAYAEDFFVERTSKGQAIIRVNDVSTIEFLEIGDQVKIETESGGKCNIVVSQISKSRLKVNTQKCRRNAQINMGESLKDLGTDQSPITEASFDEEDHAPTKPSRRDQPTKRIIPESNPIRFSIGLTYATPSTIDYNSIPNLAGAKATARFESTFGLAVGLQKIRKNSWGFLAGLNYEFNRKFQTGAISTSTGTVAFNDGGVSSGLQITTIHIGPLYRWDSYYIPLGVSLSSINKFGEYFKTSGQMGFQIGYGLMFGEAFALEFMGWSHGLNSEVLGSGNLVGLTAMAKYVQ